VDPGVEALVVTYDGTFTDGNWDYTIRHVRVHVLEDPDDDADDATTLHTFTREDCGVVFITVPPGVNRYVRYQAVNIAGVVGPLSEASAAVVALEAADAELLNNLDTVVIPGIEAAVNTINTVTIPDLNTNLATLTSDISDLNTDLDAAEATLTVINAKFPITAPDIDAGAVTTAKIAADAVTAAQIAAGEIGSSELAAGAVVAGKIAALTIVAGDIAAGTITGAKIAATTIAAGNIVANTITASQIAANTLTATEIAANAITASELAANAVTAAKILAGEIATSHMTANTINGDRITANTLNANKIVANSITASQIQALTITAAEIAALTITGGKIVSQTITATQIATGTITASQIAAGTITASRIAAGTITANEIAAGTITASLLSATAIDGKTITGAVMQTAASGERMVIRNDGSGGILESFSGLSGETAGYMDPAAYGSRPTITIATGTTGTYTEVGMLTLRSGVADAGELLVNVNQLIVGYGTRPGTELFRVSDGSGGVAQVWVGSVSTSVDLYVTQDAHLFRDVEIGRHLTVTGTGWLRPGAGGVAPTWGTSWGDFHADYEKVQVKRIGNTVYGRGSAMRSAGAATVAFTLHSTMKPQKHIVRLSRANATPDSMFINSADGTVSIGGAAYSNGQPYQFDFEFDIIQP
jgi:hypothetical protein